MRIFLAAFLVLSSSLTVTAQEACRQALALGLDVSGSVDEVEYRLQLDGLANALRTPEVQRAIFAVPNAPVALAVFEWSGMGQQRLLVGWTRISAPEQLEAIAARLRGSSASYTDPSTAIGSAMLYGATLLAQQHECWQRTLDISGDGPSNSGPAPKGIKQTAMDGITVNGLVVLPLSRANIDKDLTGVKTLKNYYETEVIRGPGAFVEIAGDFQDFERAMTRKLIREIQGMIVSQARPVHPDASR